MSNVHRAKMYGPNEEGQETETETTAELAQKESKTGGKKAPREGRKKKNDVDRGLIEGNSSSDSESSRRRRRRDIDVELADYDEEIVACDAKLKELLREDSTYAALEEKFRAFL